MIMGTDGSFKVGGAAFVPPPGFAQWPIERQDALIAAVIKIGNSFRGNEGGRWVELRPVP